MAEGLFNPIGSDIYDRLDAMGLEIPKPAMVMPSTETTGGSAGTDDKKYAQQGHSHPRLTSTTNATLGADGTASVVFTRSFSNQPGVVLTEVNAAGNQPLVMVVKSFVMTGDQYTGAVIAGFRSRALPSQTSLSLSALLSGIITSINTLVASLTNYNVFGGVTEGAQVSVIAIARSDV